MGWRGGGRWEAPSKDWNRLCAASKFDNLYIKCSGTHWLPETAVHAQDATLDLLDHYGADHLMFGTDFPKYPAIIGDGGYQRTWRTFDKWAAETVSEAQRDALAGGTVAKLFGFGGSKM